MQTRLGLGALAVAAALQGCNTSGCMENRNSVPLAGFYAADSVANSISLDSLQVTGAGIPASAAPLLEAGTRASQLYLPMRPTHQSVQWIFAYKWKALDLPALADTLTFDYTSEPFFASIDCGAIYKYRITRMAYTTHIIDSVSVTDSLITNTDVERIRIFFRVARPQTQP